MKYGLLFSLLILGGGRMMSQGIEFFKGSWEEAVAKAEAEDKLIFVDAYASWCGPCKRMSNNVFPNDRVGEFYNKNFVNLKWDMEKDEHGIKFRQKYPVSAFPTLYYIDFTGKTVQDIRGAQTVEQFIELGQKALRSVDRSDLYVADYDKGDRSPDLVYKYIKALNRVGKPSQKITNDYLRMEKPDLSKEENLRIVFEGTVDADSRAFELLLEHRDRINALFGKANVDARIYNACKSTVDKAIEFSAYDLIREVKGIAKKYLPEQAEAFAYHSEMDYALKHKDVDSYVKAAKGYLAKIAQNDPDAHSQIATVIARVFHSDQKAMDKAEEFAAKAAKISDSYDYFYPYAVILNQNGKTSEALEVAEKSLEQALEKNDGQAIKVIEIFIQRLRQG